ncbi:MAG: carbamate kinase [Planctomycetes bacterium]|nr:carbamate kinase [Planctomycetota bacterium]
MAERIVVALGGHALLKPGQSGAVEEQRANLREALRGVARLARDGHRIALTHGNGPQVGHILTRVRAARGKAYDLPLDVCVAQSQGETGYLILQALEELRIPAVAALTMVSIDPHDPALSKPTKPVGPALSAEEAEELRRRGAAVREDPGRGLRLLVPSPRPKRILGLEPFRSLFEQGVVVVLAGGGGIPVVETPGPPEGVAAVIDKDFVAAELGILLRAGRLLSLTSVERVKLHFREAGETDLERMTPSEAERRLAEGHFHEGTMRPKIEAALRFLGAVPGGCVDISTPERALDAWDGRAGTRIS